jgi:hypothetical protein
LQGASGCSEKLIDRAARTSPTNCNANLGECRDQVHVVVRIQYLDALAEIWRHLADDTPLVRTGTGIDQPKPMTPS